MRPPAMRREQLAELLEDLARMVRADPDGPAVLPRSTVASLAKVRQRRLRDEGICRVVSAMPPGRGQVAAGTRVVRRELASPPGYEDLVEKLAAGRYGRLPTNRRIAQLYADHLRKYSVPVSSEAGDPFNLCPGAKRHE